jgi:hypothetical protein
MFILRKIENHIILEEALLTHRLAIKKKNALGDWSYECTPSRLNVFGRSTVLPACLLQYEPKSDHTILSAATYSVRELMYKYYDHRSSSVHLLALLLYSETSVTVLFLLSILIVNGVHNIQSLK